MRISAEINETRPQKWSLIRGRLDIWRQIVRSYIHPSLQIHSSKGRQHEMLLHIRLMIGSLVLSLAPMFLACFGAPTAWQISAFLCLLVPLVSALILSRTGNLVASQWICVMANIGLTFSFYLGGHFSLALAWLLIIPIEGAISLDMRMLLASVTAALVAAFVMVISQPDYLVLTPVFSPWVGFLLFALSLGYSTVLTVAGIKMHGEAIDRARRTHARFRSLSEAMGDLVLRHDSNGGVVYASDHSQNLLGIDALQLHGDGFFERIHVADRPAFLKAISDALSFGATLSVILRLRLKSEQDNEIDASPLRKVHELDEGFQRQFAWVDLRARRIDFESEWGESVGKGAVVSIVRDITAVKEHEETLEAARRNAEQINLWKDRFLANVSHELRTPLNAIIGFSELLANPELAPREISRQREYADIIHTSGEHLLSVVNTILDMSKLEAGRFEIRPEHFDLSRLMDTCCDMISLKAKEGGLTLVRDYIDNPLREEIVADRRACKQILINLLSNAVKFTPAQGRVVVGVRPQGNMILLYVSDDGIGIHAEDMARLGDPFFQATYAYDRNYEGTGLGLSVVRGLVGLHGGHIRIESAQGQGTCITVALPLDCRKVQHSSQAPIETVLCAPRNDINFLQSPTFVVKKSA